MAERQECNILLTAYSTIGYGKVSTLKSKDHNLDDLVCEMYQDDEEKSFMDKALVTSESVLKYLVLPKKGENPEKPIKLSKVFSFTTDDVAGRKKKGKKDNKDKKEEVIPPKKEYSFTENKVDKKVYQYEDGVKKTIYKSDKEFIDLRLRTIYKFAWESEPRLDIEDIQIADETEGIETNVKNIFEMIDGIIKYIEKKREDHDVRVFVDITGGFRTIPLYLLFVLNVLEKRGIDVDRILYAQMDRSENTIEIDDLTPVVKTQNFINGIHEFIEFGSAQELSKYFRNILKLSSSKTYELQYKEIIQGMLDSVEEFAEAITISNQKEFKNAIDNIKAQWEELDKVDVESILKPKNPKKPEEIDIGQYIEYRNLKLLQVFSPRIKKEYNRVWNAKSRLDYIRWCLDHNFIQQALTMYIEMVPDILIKSKKYRKLVPTEVISRKTTKKITEDTPLKLEKKSKHFLHVLKQKELSASHGKSPYKFKYWLLNQYTVNIQDERQKLATKKVQNIRNSLKGLLKAFANVNNTEWFIKLQDTSKVNYLNEFFGDAITKLKGCQMKDFDVTKLEFDSLIIDEEQFNSNWKWIVSTLIDKEKIRSLCMQALDALTDSLADESNKNKNAFNNITAEGILDEVEKMVTKKYTVDMTLDEATQVEHKSILVGAVCLKEKIQKSIGQCLINKVSENYTKNETQESINNAVDVEQINLQTQQDLDDLLETLGTYKNQDIVLDAIQLVKKEIDKAFAERKPYKLRKEFLKWDKFPVELLLPYKIKKIMIEEAPKLSEMLVSTDHYSKVDDLEYLIGEKKICINSALYESINNGECDLECDAESIVKLIQSISGADIEEAENKAEKYFRIIPESIGGKSQAKDIWDRDTLTLLILRTILYPYNTLKMIRNDSVHAREKRNFNVTREYVAELIKQSIGTIEKYLEYCK